MQSTIGMLGTRYDLHYTNTNNLKQTNLKINYYDKQFI